MRTAFRILGQAVGGLVVIAAVVGRGLWVWSTGSPWRRGYRRRRRLSRRVRAAGNWAVLAVAVGLWLAPLPTLVVLAWLLTLALGARVSRWRDRLMVVRVGRPARTRHPAPVGAGRPTLPAQRPVSGRFPARMPAGGGRR